MTPASKLEQVRPKSPIAARDALRSALRLWLAYRDQVVWLLVSGVGSESGDPVLASIDLSPVTALAARMDEMRKLTYDWAAQIDEKRAETEVRAELQALLASESPRFLLRVPEAPGAF